MNIFKKKFQNVRADQVKDWMNDAGYLIIDVREPFEFKKGHIPTAKNIPLNSIPNRLSEFDKDKNIIVVCASGGRSSNAANYLSEAGYNVSNMMGGMMAWAGPIQ